MALQPSYLWRSLCFHLWELLAGWPFHIYRRVSCQKNLYQVLPCALLCCCVFFCYFTANCKDARYSCQGNSFWNNYRGEKKKRERMENITGKRITVFSVTWKSFRILGISDLICFPKAIVQHLWIFWYLISMHLVAFIAWWTYDVSWRDNFLYFGST